LDGGRIAYEHDRMLLVHNAVPASFFSRASRELFLTLDTTEEKLMGYGGQPSEILTNFTAAILDGVPLIAPEVEGVNSLELTNAMLFSAWTDKTVEIPLTTALHEKWLKRKITASRDK
jgi:hypothetical protein